jgi:hypothetical protein
MTSAPMTMPMIDPSTPDAGRNVLGTRNAPQPIVQPN